MSAHRYRQQNISHYVQRFIPARGWPCIASRPLHLPYPYPSPQHQTQAHPGPFPVMGPRQGREGGQIVSIHFCMRAKNQTFGSSMIHFYMRDGNRISESSPFHFNTRAQNQTFGSSLIHFYVRAQNRTFWPCICCILVYTCLWHCA